MTATSAARDAANRDDFFDAGRDGDRRAPRAAVGTRGGASSRSPARPPSSTRRSVRSSSSTSAAARPSSPSARPSSRPALSTDIGCVRFTEKYLEHDPPRPEELVAALSVAEAYVDDVRQAIPEAGEAKTFVGLAGTVTTAAAVEIGLATYDRDRIHHFVLTKEAAEDVFRTLATETLAERIAQPRPRGGPGRRHRRRHVRAGHDHAPPRLRRLPGQRGRHPRRPGPLADRPVAALVTMPAVPLTDRVLMGPGPCNPYPEVTAAFARPMLGHLDPEFIELLDETNERLRQVFRTANAADLPGERHRLGRHGGGVRQRGRARRRRRGRRQRRVRRAHVRRGRPLRRRGRAGRRAVGPAARSRRRCSTPTRRRAVIAVGARRDLDRRAQRRGLPRPAAAHRTPRRSCWSTASRRSAASRSRSTAGASTWPTAAPRSASACRPGLAPFTAGARAVDRAASSGRSPGTSTSTCSPATSRARAPGPTTTPRRSR